MSKNSSNRNEVAYFGGGCFWGVEQAFRNIDGVVDTAVGYMGGQTQDPTYEQVCTNTTGHAEVVQVVYDPKKVTYDTLLETFWEVHDPTQVNRQGPDIGTQYRSVVFFTTPEQRKHAEESKQKLQQTGKYAPETVATAIESAGTFNKAEEYHQQYLAKQGKNVCH